MTNHLPFTRENFDLVTEQHGQMLREKVQVERERDEQHALVFKLQDDLMRATDITGRMHGQIEALRSLLLNAEREKAQAQQGLSAELVAHMERAETLEEMAAEAVRHRARIARAVVLARAAREARDLLQALPDNPAPTAWEAVAGAGLHEDAHRIAAALDAALISLAEDFPDDPSNLKGEAALIADIHKFRAALKRYGSHAMSCLMAAKSSCFCGLDDILGEKTLPPDDEEDDDDDDDDDGEETGETGETQRSTQA